MSETPDAPKTGSSRGLGSLPGSHPDEVADADVAELLTRAAPEIAPPDGLFDRIVAGIDEAEENASITRRAHEGEWQQLSPHIWRKVLHKDTASDRSIYYLRCAPGAVIPPHYHDHDEHALVLEGAFEVGGLTVRAGDTHFSRAGTTHAPLHSAEGCLLLMHA
jgi:quercetin dioxygenase-like cupin family protein